MKQDVGFCDFCDSFSGSYADNFSYSGKKALYNYLIDFEEDTGEELELDPIAFCCDFTEYESFEELQKDYDYIETIDELKDKTVVIPIEDIYGKQTDGLIIQNF